MYWSSTILLTALYVAALVSSQSDQFSEVIAVFLVGRHGDRTSKVEGNTQLTTLGKNQVFESATYFQNLYLVPTSPNRIQNVDFDYLYNQVYAAAPYQPISRVEFDL